MGWAGGSSLLGRILEEPLGWTQEQVDVMCEEFWEFDCDTFDEIDHPMVQDWVAREWAEE